MYGLGLEGRCRGVTPGERPVAMTTRDFRGSITCAVSPQCPGGVFSPRVPACRLPCRVGRFRRGRWLPWSMDAARRRGTDGADNGRSVGVRPIGRDFTTAELALLCGDRRPAQPSRAGPVEGVLRRIGWYRPDGEIKGMMARRSAGRHRVELIGNRSSRSDVAALVPGLSRFALLRSRNAFDNTAQVAIPA